MALTAHYQYKIITTQAEFSLLEKSWDRLPQALCSPLLQFNWFQAYARVMKSNEKLHIITQCLATDPEKITAIAPLSLTKKNAISALEIMGSSCLFEPTSFLFDRPQYLELLFVYLLSLKIPLSLKRLPKEQADQLQQMSKLCLLKQGNGAMYWQSPVALSSSENLFAPRLNKQLKRKTKLAAKHGQLSFIASKPDTRTFQQELSQFVAIENNSWKNSSKTSLFHDHKLHAFFAGYGKLMAQGSRIYVFYLLVNNKKIAARICVEHNQSLFELKIGYDEAYKQCSPGLLLTAEVLRYIHQEQLKGLEFLGNSETWQKQFTNQQRQDYSCKFYPCSLTGIGKLLSDLIAKLAL